jgi:hypothetical protein
VSSRARLFTDEELAAMRSRTVDRVIGSLERGDTAAAAEDVAHLFREFEAMHRLYRWWGTSLLTFIGERFGDDALAEALHRSVADWWLPFVRRIAEGDDLARSVRGFASGLRGHLVPVEVEEDEEKVTIRMTPCGSGGRLVREGVYDGPDGFLTVRGPRPLTHGFDEMPVYCCHQPFMELVAIEEFGWPAVVIEPECDRGTCNCAFLIYKDPSRVPDRYYTRLGLEPPNREGDGT